MQQPIQRENNREVERVYYRPPNALASVIARAYSKSGADSNKQTQQKKTTDGKSEPEKTVAVNEELKVEGPNEKQAVEDTKKYSNGKSRRRGNSNVSDGAERIGYSMQVNEFFPDLRKRQIESAVICVTLRELYHYNYTNEAERKLHQRVWIPIGTCSELLQILQKTVVGTDNSAASSSSSKGLGSTKDIDLSRLEPTTLVDPECNKKVEIEKVSGKWCLRSYMGAKEKKDFKEGDTFEMATLYPELLPKFLRFLKDTATRYVPIMDMKFPSLYSYSGERRFYFDCRNSRWGVRLQISQVTEKHRNTIGVPLDSVVAFRDHLNEVLDKLDLNSNEKKNSRNIKGRRNQNKGRIVNSSRRPSRKQSNKNENRQRNRKSKVANTSNTATATDETETSKSPKEVKVEKLKKIEKTEAVTSGVASAGSDVNEVAVEKKVEVAVDES